MVAPSASMLVEKPSENSLNSMPNKLKCHWLKQTKRTNYLSQRKPHIFNKENDEIINSAF